VEAKASTGPFNPNHWVSGSYKPPALVAGVNVSIYNFQISGSVLMTSSASGHLSLMIFFAYVS